MEIKRHRDILYKRIFASIIILGYEVAVGYLLYRSIGMIQRNHGAYLAYKNGLPYNWNAYEDYLDGILYTVILSIFLLWPFAIFLVMICSGSRRPRSITTTTDDKTQPLISV